MRLINTDGMAFIGPGSEWFWTALTGLVLGVTFLAIYRQLAIARSASAREQLNSLDREWFSERLIRYQLAVLIALREGADRAHLPDGPAAGLANWWDGVAQLARGKDLDQNVLCSRYGTICQSWWSILAPQVRRTREERHDPGISEDFEWVAGLMAELDGHAGMPKVDETGLGPLEVTIAKLQGLLRVEETLRSVIVASPDAPSTATWAADAAPAPI